MLANQCLRELLYLIQWSTELTVPDRSNVLEHITATRGLRHDSAISFAYYNYRNSELQEPSHVIKALIKQLCRKLESIPDWLLRFQNESHSPSTVGKKETFVSLAEGYQEVFLIIDALDECPMSKRPHIIEFITNVASSLPRAKIFITSRRESDIVRAFESSRTPTIQIRAENVAADIERYVCNEVEKLRQGYHGKKLLLNSSASERRIINTLTAKADGMCVIQPKSSIVEKIADRVTGSFGSTFNSKTSVELARREKTT